MIVRALQSAAWSGVGRRFRRASNAKKRGEYETDRPIPPVGECVQSPQLCEFRQHPRRRQQQDTESETAASRVERRRGVPAETSGDDVRRQV